jgi:hypothetical protein
MISGIARMPFRPMQFLIGRASCLIMAYAVFTARF